MALQMQVQAKIKNARLLIEIPDSAINGAVKVTIDKETALVGGLTLDEVRLRLLAGGSLQNQFGSEKVIDDISEDELEILEQMPADAPTINEVLDEIRGEY